MLSTRIYARKIDGCAILYVMNIDEAPQISRAIPVKFILGLVAALAIVLYFIFGGASFLSPGDVEVPNAFFPRLDSVTAGCLEKTPIAPDPQLGIYKLQNRGSFADYFYKAVLLDVGAATVAGCDFVTLSMTTKNAEGLYGQNQTDSRFTLYFPENLPSPGTKKSLAPVELAQYKGKTLEMLVRYGLSRDKNEVPTFHGILGWQLISIWISKSK